MDLKPNKIKKCRKYLETLTLTIIETNNLFWLNVNKKILFNIKSGKSARKQTALIFVPVTDIGNRACEEFIKECKNNPKKVWRKDKKTEDT